MLHFTREEAQVIDYKCQIFCQNLLTNFISDYTLEVSLDNNDTLTISNSNSIIFTSDDISVSLDQPVSTSTIIATAHQRLYNAKYRFLKTYTDTSKCKELQGKIRKVADKRIREHNNIMSNSANINNVIIRDAALKAQKDIIEKKQEKQETPVEEVKEVETKSTINTYFDLVHEKLGYTSKTTDVKLNTSGKCTLSKDEKNKMIILTEVFKEFDKPVTTTKFMYDIELKKTHFVVNEKQQDINDLFLSLDCSLSFKKDCDLIKTVLDDAIVIDTDVLLRLREASVFENDCVSNEKTGFNPFKKTNIE